MLTRDAAPLRGAMRKRYFSLASLALFSFLVMGYFWWGRFRYEHSQMLILTYGGCALLAIVNHVYHGDDLKRLGLRGDNFIGTGRRWGLLTAALCLGIALAGLLFGELELASWENVAAYVLWAPLQQHALQNFLRLRSREALSPTGGAQSSGPSTQAVLLAAALFAAYHLPNPMLAGAAFLGAALWCGLYERAPNLFWAAISNSAVTICLMIFFKYSIFNQFEVGWGGYRYEFYGGGVQVAGGLNAQGKPFVATLPGHDKKVPALVRVFDPGGEKLAEWVAFEGLTYSGQIAVGDLGFGPGDEIVTVPGPGADNPPLVRVFDPEGGLLGEFSAGWQGGYGLSAAIGCGDIYLTPGPAPHAPQRVFRYSPQGRLLASWDFPDLGLVNSLRAAALCGDRLDLREKALPRLLLLWGSDISVNRSTIHLFDPAGGRKRSFPTIGTTFGLHVSLIKIDDRELVATAPGPLRGYPPLIQIYDLEGQKVQEFAASLIMPEGCGANLGSLDMDGDGREEVLLGEGVCPGQPAIVSIRNHDGSLRAQWNAYPEKSWAR